MSLAEPVAVRELAVFDRTASVLAVVAQLSAAREAQTAWATVPVPQRLRRIRLLRSLIAQNAGALLSPFPSRLRRTRADSLSAEIIPLAEACRYLELNACKWLQGQKVSCRGRPLWLNRVEIQLVRDALGVILLVGPANYPLFLPGVQALQALVAGNAVLWKPGLGGTGVARELRRLMVLSGIPQALVCILPEDVVSVARAIECGVDKVVLTGSAQAGKAVYSMAAQAMIPVVLELSGEDAAFVRPGADVARAARAISFAATLNGGETCIAPKRIVVWRQIADAFLNEWNKRPDSVVKSLRVTIVANDDEALAIARGTDYALGATVFGTEHEAVEFARKLNAGVVVVNDAVVPTADPRLPFGGRKLSGFGTTRGKEGLLEFTALKAVAIQRGRRLRHLDPAPANLADLLCGFLGTSHGLQWRMRWDSLRLLGFALFRANRKDGPK